MRVAADAGVRRQIDVYAGQGAIIPRQIELRSAVQDISAGASVKVIPAGASEELVVSVQTLQRVGSPETIDEVIARTADQMVGAFSAIDNHGFTPILSEVVRRLRIKINK
ncbi:hypothetical protein GCM10010983_25730 [Caulobacter rhizosphaerae]|nr:hypothetical protein GCM10010983_25730 [Caulobacter rhizosphaerae]